MLKEIVFTGGACGGKTTAMNHAAVELEKRGFKVFKVPEIATRVMEMGYDIPGGINTPREVQRTINTEILQQQQLVRSWAQKYEKAVILYDRFVVDGIAFYDKNDLLLRDMGLTWFSERQWPDAVIHMVSTAVDQPYLFGTHGNVHRYSTPEQAAEEDRNIMQAWVTHSHLRVVGNQGTFQDKLNKATEHVRHALQGDEVERKFLVDSVCFPEGLVHDTKMIEQMYSDGVRYSKCAWRGQATYQKAVKEGEGVRRSEEEEWLTAQDWRFYNMAVEEHPDIWPATYLTKTRDNFVWNNRFYELDHVVGENGLMILEIELTSEDEKYEIPPFINVVKEVTDDPRYMSKNLAKPRSALDGDAQKKATLA